MPVPRWIVGMFDPAQRFMERTAGRRRRRLPRRWLARGRLPRGSASYGVAPLTAGGRRRRGRGVPDQPVQGAGAPSEDLQERLRQRAESQRARLEEVLSVHGDALESAARQLMDVGAAEVTTGSASLSARIVRFRWGDSVLEVQGHRFGAGPARDGARMRYGSVTESRTRLSREGERLDVLVHSLAGMLAELTP